MIFTKLIHKFPDSQDKIPSTYDQTLNMDIEKLSWLIFHEGGGGVKWVWNFKCFRGGKKCVKFTHFSFLNLIKTFLDK